MRGVTVECMSTKDALADQLSEAVAGFLTVPLMELYALLWRAGAVQVVVDPPRRPIRGCQLQWTLICEYAGRDGHRERSQPRLSPAPVPSRAGRAACSRAVG